MDRRPLVEAGEVVAGPGTFSSGPLSVCRSVWRCNRVGPRPIRDPPRHAVEPGPQQVAVADHSRARFTRTRKTAWKASSTSLGSRSRERDGQDHGAVAGDDRLEGVVVAAGDEAVEELALAEPGERPGPEQAADLRGGRGELGAGHGERPRCWTCILLVLADRGPRRSSSPVFSGHHCNRRSAAWAGLWRTSSTLCSASSNLVLVAQASAPRQCELLVPSSTIVEAELVRDSPGHAERDVLDVEDHRRLRGPLGLLEPGCSGRRRSGWSCPWGPSLPP